MSLFSKVYSMDQQVLRKQTHLGNLNIFKDIKCSICNQKGHNKLFCINIDIPGIIDELVETIYNFVLTNSCKSLSRSLEYICSFPYKIMSQICIYLKIYSSNYHTKKINIYLKIRKLIFQKYNIKIINISKNIQQLFKEHPPSFGPINIFPNNDSPAYSLDLYCDSPVFNVLGCYQYASNILLKYGNRFTPDAEISLDLFTNLLFIDILKFTYDSQYTVLSSMQVSYNEQGDPYDFGHTISHFRVLIDNEQIYPYAILPSYFHPSSRLIIHRTNNMMMYQEFTTDEELFREEFPIPSVFHIQLKITTSIIAEQKTIEKIPGKIISTECISNDCAENKCIEKVTKEEIEEEKELEEKELEEKTLYECPICYHNISNQHIIMINSCHKYCVQCIISYLHSAKLKQPTCALCRDNITSLESNDTNILLLKNQFRLRL
jgi:hypothetical protein